ncbi:MAG TPA: hypothetical protein EYP86_03805 [Candidatus Altiarchaeales archaeon]|nr:hypothetical protein [Candidatus Altiarchaeales archaeon]
MEKGAEHTPPLSDIAERLSREFCQGLRYNDNCNVPSPWDTIPWGVCCNGVCTPGVNDCKSFSNTEDPSFIDIMKKVSCMNSNAKEPKGDGEKCDIPADIKRKYNLWGVCCSGRCSFWSDRCIREEEPESGERFTKKYDNQGEFRTLATTSCNGMNDGEECRIPAGVRDRYDIWGVCCSGKCSYWKNECDKQPEKWTPEQKIELLSIISCYNVNDGEECRIPDIPEAEGLNLSGVCCSNMCKFGDKKCSESVCGDNICDTGERETCPDDCTDGKDTSFFILIFVVAFFIIIIMVFVFYFLSFRKPSIDYELQIKKLLDEKKSIEEMIEIAKKKYHQRKLDEESFREIVRDNQKKLIEIEAKIDDIEKRIKKLEK